MNISEIRKGFKDLTEIKDQASKVADRELSNDGGEGELQKFIFAEILIGTIIMVTVDIACMVIELISFMMGAFLTPIIQGAVTAGTWAWFKFKGGQEGTGRWMVKFAANLLPTTPIILTAFTLTISFLISVYYHNQLAANS